MICEKVGISMEKQVLIIDDDPVILRLMRSYLQDGYKVNIVNSGKAAIRFLDKFLPDVILLDYMMPEDDGPATLRMIRQHEGCADTPVIFMTGLIDQDLKDQCADLHPYDYLQKPVKQQVLLDILNNI